MKRVVVIGGGTGTFVTLSALKLLPNVELTAIVTVADSGGSTGRLRDEFGFQPVGDLRQALAALAASEGRRKKAAMPAGRQEGRRPNEKNWIRELLLYRFSKGHGLEGHNLGNLILTALQDMTGSTANAIEVASSIFRLQGHIYPITTKNIQLVVEYQDGTVEVGEHKLDDYREHGGDRIVGIRTSPRANIYGKAKTAIESADFVILGPGDLYASILPNLVIEGTPFAVKRSRAKFFYVMNLMTRYTETHGMTATDHLTEVERYLNCSLDCVIVNSATIPSRIRSVYRQQHEYPVIDDLRQDRTGARIYRAPLMKTSLVERHASDKVSRSYLRHDPRKLTDVFKEVMR